MIKESSVYWHVIKKGTRPGFEFGLTVEMLKGSGQYRYITIC